jgi:hypothetical protein
MGKDLATVTQVFLSEVREALGEDLGAVVLFGSAAAGRHVAGRSDVNFLLVAKRIDRRHLDSLAMRSKRWSRMGIAPPLIVEPSFLHSSLDSYPLEILGMLAAHQPLFGPDPLDGLLPATVHVRLQAEREIKAKQLWLRRGYLESQGSATQLLGLLRDALPSIDAILRGLVFLRGGQWKPGGKELYEEGARLFDIDASVLVAIGEVRAGRSRPDRPATFGLYGRLLDLLSSLAGAVEQAAGSMSTPAS